MSTKGEAKQRQGAWLPLESAAAHLSMNAAALRKALERRATRAADGATEANLDGVRARKFGRIWRVRFSEAWGLP
ncbi:MAG TPA: hypothetical protein PK156_50560 [Polyangium sp.]|nr:hypothetical protein [Polyangium sp.]